MPTCEAANTIELLFGQRRFFPCCCECIRSFTQHHGCKYSGRRGHGHLSSSPGIRPQASYAFMRHYTSVHAPPCMCTVGCPAQPEVVRTYSFLLYFSSHFILYFQVRGKEPAVAHRTESAPSWPGSTGGRDEQPNLSALNLSLH